MHVNSSYLTWKMNACMRIYVHTLMHTPAQVQRVKQENPIQTHTHTYIHTYIHTHTHVQAPAQRASRKILRIEYLATTHTYIHTCMHACMHAYIHTHTHLQAPVQRVKQENSQSSIPSNKIKMSKKEIRDKKEAEEVAKHPYIYICIYIYI